MHVKQPPAATQLAPARHGLVRQEDGIITQECRIISADKVGRRSRAAGILPFSSARQAIAIGGRIQLPVALDLLVARPAILLET